jgi:tyrosyl-tRNA synthetase
MDSVRLRLEREQNLSFLEFNYMLLQAYDFYWLHKNYKCALQIGGSDQWGNIVSGVDLVRRMAQQEVYGLTTPLITTASGAKMGKSASGAVWLNGTLLAPYDYWQFWRNVEDRDVLRFMKLYTDLTLEEINEYERMVAVDINQAKKILATEATKLCHGNDAALEAAQAAASFFEKGVVSEHMPTYALEIDIVRNVLPIYELLRMTELSSSNNEAKKLIRGGGARLNQQSIQDEMLRITEEHFTEGTLVLSAGKKRHVRVRIA